MFAPTPFPVYCTLLNAMPPSCLPLQTPTTSVIVEYLVRVLQYGVDDTNLPTCILDIRSSICTHECRSKDNR